MKVTKHLKTIIYILAFFGGLIHLINSAAGLIVPLQMRPLHLGIIMVLALLTDIIKSADKKHGTIRNIINVALLVFAVLGTSYIAFNYEKVAMSAGYVTNEIVIYGSMIVAVVLVIAWRSVGAALTVVAGVFLAYALLGQYLPDIIGHRGYSFSRIINFLYTNANGIYGVPIDTSARYLVLFMIMAEFIERSGTGKLFMAIADFIAKRTRGGAAKSSIVASALFGTISGTPIANVMVTGAFTIPMMKKSGFKDTFAAGVEATASTGGLIMPPIMGAGAFIMAEILGITYGTVMLAAIIPAILYYFSLYLAVDYYSAKHGVNRVTDIKDDIAARIKLYVHTCIPLVFFIISVTIGYSVFRSAIIAIIATPIVAYIRKETRMSMKDILEGIKDGMKKTISLGAATACAGIIVGVISLTGFGFSFSALLGTFNNIPIVALLITMLICIVLGMGMPAVASYLIAATITAPTLIDMGFMPIAVHMFLFYFTAFSSVTPPVALASYTAAGLAECDPWKTGYEAFKLASVAFLAPFIFVYSPGLLAQTGLMDVLVLLSSSVLGVFAFVAGIQGYLFGNVDNLLFRGLLIVGGCLMIIPEIISTIIGVVLTVAIHYVNKAVRNSKAKTAY